ncbi:hypothetical protein [Nodosilinea sp. LEGE 07298]|nr:hypothetical protein [Nodosilinea sp. LEGE 07298]
MYQLPVVSDRSYGRVGTGDWGKGRSPQCNLLNLTGFKEDWTN